MSAGPCRRHGMDPRPCAALRFLTKPWQRTTKTVAKAVRFPGPIASVTLFLHLSLAGPAETTRRRLVGF